MSTNGSGRGGPHNGQLGQNGQNGHHHHDYNQFPHHRLLQGHPSYPPPDHTPSFPDYRDTEGALHHPSNGYWGMENDQGEGGGGHHHPNGRYQIKPKSSTGMQRERRDADSTRRTSEESSASLSPGSGGRRANGSGKGDKSKNKLCEVCGDIAKSLHFGGLSCDSCKAFFRRSVHKDAYVVFSCGYDNSCHISKQTRKSCQKCRFEKCVRIGMEKKWVMSEEERKALTENRLKKKCEALTPTTSPTHQGGSTSPNSGSNSDHHHSPGSSSHDETDPEPEYIPNVENMLNFMTEQDQRDIREVCEYYRISYDKIPYNVPKTTNGARDTLQVIGMFTTILRRFAYFSKLVPEFCELGQPDQGALLKASVLEMVMLRGALSFDIENHRWPNTNLEFLANCPQLKVEDMENLVSPELFEMHMNFIKKVQKLQVDEPTVMMLLLIVMFYPERSELNNPEKVTTAQEKYCELLRKYVNWRYGPLGTKLYPRLLTQLSDLRQLNDLHTEYHLNLAETEVNVIRQDLTQLHLNPYPQWKIVTPKNKASPNQDDSSSSQDQEPPPPPSLPPVPAPKATGPIRSSSLRAHSRMREAFLKRIPQLIEDPFGPLMTPEEMMKMGQQVGFGIGSMGSMGHSGVGYSNNSQQQPPPQPFDPWQHRSQRNGEGNNAYRSQTEGETYGGLDQFHRQFNQYINRDPPLVTQQQQQPPQPPLFDASKLQNIQNIMESLNPETMARLRTMFFSGAFSGMGGGPDTNTTTPTAVNPDRPSPAITPGLFANLFTSEGQQNFARVVADIEKGGEGGGVKPTSPN